MTNHTVYYTVYVRGEALSFESDLTAEEAAKILETRQKTNYSDFAASLLLAYSANRLSLKQRPWFFKLAEDAKEDHKAELLGGEYLSVLEPFQVAASLGKKKLKLRFGDLAIHSVTRSDSPNAGGVYLFWDNSYCGKITKDGVLKAPTLPTLAHNLLNEVKEDPVEAAIKYGQETGCCAVCARTLSDPVSVFSGIGPVCLTSIAGAEARKEMERAYALGDRRTLIDALRELKAKRDKQAEAPRPAEEVVREEYESDVDYNLAKALAGL